MNKDFKIVGIAGKARAGKDEATQIILNDIFVSYYRYGLADPIKNCVNEIFGWGEREGYGDLKEKVVFKWFKLDDVELSCIIKSYIGEHIKYAYNRPKVLSRAFITEVLKDSIVLKFGNYMLLRTSPRIMYQRFGTDFARKRVSKDSIWFDIAPQHGIIVSDVRFENEAQWIRDNGGIVIHIEREGLTGSLVAEHDSENGIAFNKDDVKIINVKADDWLQQLRKNINNVFK